MTPLGQVVHHVEDHRRIGTPEFGAADISLTDVAVSAQRSLCPPDLALHQLNTAHALDARGRRPAHGPGSLGIKTSRRPQPRDEQPLAAAEIQDTATTL